MSNLIFFQEEMLYVAQKLINLKETKDDGKAGADLQYTNQLINCISLDPKYIQKWMGFEYAIENGISRN